MTDTVTRWRTFNRDMLALNAKDMYRLIYATTDGKPGDLNRAPIDSSRPDLRSQEQKRDYVLSVIHSENDFNIVDSIMDWIRSTPGTQHSDYVYRDSFNNKINNYPIMFPGQYRKGSFLWAPEPNSNIPVPSNPEPAKEPNVKIPANGTTPGVEDAAGQMMSILTGLMGNAINEDRVRSIVADAMKNAEPHRVEIVVTHKGEPRIIPGHVRPEFQTILARANRGTHQLLIGPAGSGKTHVCDQVAKALGLELFIISGAGDITPTTLFGRWMPTGENGRMEFHEGVILKWARLGGLLLIDEMDAMDPTCLLSLNLALAQNMISVAQTGEVIPLHEDCRVIATANTYGQGATVQYSGREALDGATINRFQMGRMVLGYDEAFEKASVPADLFAWAMPIRKRILELGLRRVLSTRDLLNAAHSMADGESLSLIKETFFIGWTDDEKMKVKA